MDQFSNSYKFPQGGGGLFHRYLRERSQERSSPLFLPPPPPVRLPPSQAIAEETRKVLDPEVPLFAKPAAALMAGLNVFGLPQELATRALGGETGVPSRDFPFAVEALTLGGRVSRPIAELATDVILDPLNFLFGAGLARGTLKGAMEATAIGSEVKDFNKLRVSLNNERELWGATAGELEKLQGSLGYRFPIVHDEITGLRRLDISEATNPPEVLKRLRDFAQDKLDLTANLRALEIHPQQFLSRRKARLLGTFFGSPANQSEFFRSVVAQTRDTLNARAMAIERFKFGVEEIFPDLHHMKKDPLSRGIVLKILRREDLMDDEIKAAISVFGKTEFDSRVTALTTLMLDEIKRIPGTSFALSSEELAKMLLNPTGLGVEVELPTLIAKLAKKEIVRPNDIDFSDFMRFFSLSATKRAFNEPTADALERLGQSLGYGGRDISAIRAEAVAEIKGTGVSQKDLARGAKEAVAGAATPATELKALESRLLGAIVNHLRGKPSSADALITGHLVDNAEHLKKWRIFDRIIQSAEKRQPIVTLAAQKATGILYAGLLGSAVDSAAKQVTQLLNAIVELGFSRTVEGVGATLFNPKWREFLSSENIMERTSSFLTEIFETTGFGQRSKLMKAVMSPMTAMEYFNRGVTYYAALGHAMKSGIPKAEAAARGIAATDDLVRLPLGEAMRWAEEKTRQLQFGYSFLDTSPIILKEAPYLRPYAMFMNYPTKQAELVLKWASEGTGLKNKAMRFLLLTGAATALSQRAGIDMHSALGFGFGLTDYPPGVRLQPDGIFPRSLPFFNDTAFERLIADSLKAAKESLTLLFSGGPAALGQAGSVDFWRSLGSITRFIAPGGRYTQKFLREMIEYSATSSPWMRQAFYDKSVYLRPVLDLLGVKIDPDTSGFDRFARLVGYQSVRDINRKDYLKFLDDYLETQHTAVRELNIAVASGQDTSTLRQKWIDTMRRKFKYKFEKWNVPEYIIYSQIKPSEMKYAQLMSLVAPPEAKLEKRLPKEVRMFFSPQRFRQ